MVNVNEVCTSLPLDIQRGTWLELELLGIKQKKAPEKDSVFVDVVLPPGWKKEATGHPYWSQLIDEQGRRRVNIFHKNELYCNEASMYLVPRFRENIVFLDDPAQSYYYTAVDELSGVVFSSESIAKPENCTPEAFDQYVRLSDQLKRSVTMWLDANYPYWKSLLAYWGECSDQELASIADLPFSDVATEESVDFNIEDFLVFDDEEN